MLFPAGWRGVAVEDAWARWGWGHYGGHHMVAGARRGHRGHEHPDGSVDHAASRLQGQNGHLLMVHQLVRRRLSLMLLSSSTGRGLMRCLVSPWCCHKAVVRRRLAAPVGPVRVGGREGIGRTVHRLLAEAATGSGPRSGSLGRTETAAGQIMVLLHRRKRWQRLEGRVQLTRQMERPRPWRRCVERGSAGVKGGRKITCFLLIILLLSILTASVWCLK